MEEETTETNKIITTYEVEGSNLKEIRTPEEIQPEVISYDITATIAEIEKIDLVIEQWEAKKAPLQLLVDKYNELNPVVEEPVE